MKHKSIQNYNLFISDPPPLFRTWSLNQSLQDQLTHYKPKQHVSSLLFLPSLKQLLEVARRWLLEVTTIKLNEHPKMCTQ